MGSKPAVVVRSPAKVNLQLSVGGLKPDGFHDVATIYQALSLHDVITITETETDLDVMITGPQSSGVPADSTNLAAKAVHLMAREYQTPKNLRIDINKQIPVAGGMAGGSADAGGVVVGVNAMYQLGLSRAELESAAAQLGSDVPFSIAGGTAIGVGRGDRLTTIMTRGEYWWVFALSKTGLSTPSVYRELDRLRGDHAVPAPQISNPLLQALQNGDSVELGKLLSNDLQRAACSLRPDLALLIDLGLESGALGSLVSGSGPTVAFLVENEDATKDLIAGLHESGLSMEVVTARAPTSGAQVVH